MAPFIFERDGDTSEQQTRHSLAFQNRSRGALETSWMPKETTSDITNTLNDSGAAGSRILIMAGN